MFRCLKQAIYNYTTASRPNNLVLDRRPVVRAQETSDCGAVDRTGSGAGKSGHIWTSWDDHAMQDPSFCMHVNQAQPGVAAGRDLAISY